MGKGKKFLLKLLIVLTGMAIADVAVGGLMGHFYFRIRHGEQARTTYAVDSANQKILILGSSRASHHYIPAIIEDSLGMSCYNAGKDKQGVFYSLAILKAVCARHRPQGVILDITPFSFETKRAGINPPRSSDRCANPTESPLPLREGGRGRGRGLSIEESRPSRLENHRR